MTQQENDHQCKDLLLLLNEVAAVGRSGLPFMETMIKRITAHNLKEKAMDMLEWSLFRIRRLDKIKSDSERILLEFKMAKEDVAPANSKLIGEKDLLELMIEEVKDRASEERRWRKFLKKCVAKADESLPDLEGVVKS